MPRKEYEIWEIIHLVEGIKTVDASGYSHKHIADALTIGHFRPKFEDFTTVEHDRYLHSNLGSSGEMEIF